jgi:hypothetical protein
MLATLGGGLALLLGLVVLLLPLLLPELSRPRDAVWGAVVLLLGLVLVTSAERLTGAPMLGVLCGGLLIGRLGSEVAQARWRQLTPEEVQRLASGERWRTALEQLAAATAKLLTIVLELSGSLSQWLRQRRQPRSSGKRWVRPEGEAPTSEREPTALATAAPATIDAVAAPTEPGAIADAENAAEPKAHGTADVQAAAAVDAVTVTDDNSAAVAAPSPEPPDTGADAVLVSSFEEIEVLLEQAEAADGSSAEAEAALPPQPQDTTGAPPSEAG